FSPGTNRWKVRFAEPLQGTSGMPAYIAPGEAMFLQASAPTVLQMPAPAQRFQYYHQDHLGSSAVSSDAQGRLVTETAYYPYGAERRVNAVAAKPDYSFTQKERDAEHGMLNFETRLLSPLLARFIRVDSLSDHFKGQSFHMPQSLDPYSYCHNNPLALIDPDGREARVTLHGDNTI